MKFIRPKSLIVKSSVFSIILIYFLYIFREKLFVSSPCLHLYNINSFPTCAALSNRSCNITILLDSYIAYRTCILKYSSTEVDYVIFDAVNGLGNRILGLIAVTAYALVSNRILLINWQPGDNHQAYFEDLFLPLSSMDETISFYDRYSLSRLANLLKNRWSNEIEWKTKHSSSIPRDWAFYFDREILCNEKISNHHSWIVQFGLTILNFFAHHVKWIRTDQYFVPLLTRNAKLRQTFVQLFQNGQIFAQLGRRLIRPIPKVNSLIEQYQFDKKNITIGVHMRSWSSDMIDHIEPFQKCIEHVIRNVTKSSEEGIKIHLYIISNTPKRRQQLVNQISQMHTNLEILNPLEVPLVASAIEKMQYTLAELLILSHMQHLIITSKSTFGMIAQGLAQQGAWIVRQGARNEIQSIKSDLCQWESTSEPEYQMIGSVHINDSCSQSDAFLSSMGERTIV